MVYMASPETMTGATVHRYCLEGAPASLALLCQSVTGAIWRIRFSRASCRFVAYIYRDIRHAVQGLSRRKEEDPGEQLQRKRDFFYLTL